MNKLGAVAIIIAAVIAGYLFLLVVVPFLSDIIETANATMAAGSNMSNYPGTSDAFVSIPWLLWFVPGVGGIIALIVTLRS